LTITIDPGHGGDETGDVTASGVNEKDINLMVALELTRALEGLGSKVVLTREGDETAALYDRPALANAADADIFISIHHNFLPNGDAQAAAAYFFCRQGYFSEAGSLLAQHIVDNLSRELSVPAIPALGRNYAVLRETSMTAVLVEPSFINGPGLSEIDPHELARRESEAILAGIREYFTT
jgi:N-acetylmuramoyl-L-alanine amidase